MNRTIFLNGDFVGGEFARVSLFERGLLFGDGIYEVTAVVKGQLVDFDLHIDRLFRSAASIGLSVPLSKHQWRELHETLICSNELVEGIVYIQVTRGAAEREFTFDQNMAPLTFGFTQEKNLCTAEKLHKGITVEIVDDLRWKRRDIKSTSLLAQVLAKQQAFLKGAGEALLHESGVITEGGSTSVFAVDQDGVLRTHPLGPSILPGVTRHVVLQLARGESIKVLEQAIKMDELFEMGEVFVTGATYFVVPVVKIGCVSINQGSVGPVTKRLQKLYIDRAKALCVPGR
ncbi:D-amino acid aminotransferase [Bradyrhizobium cenepequi]|uniref:D-amino acid aminotransferase n=1 Tax=Bradyrhizobium cenepequi TaxID=2821403 RepID=UPI001CE256FD|nr:D-amino acid aminotransferase [Bradyrhizobium cenepequi]MCA6112811.1 D-amino acid aminotransferase [Bradyrhizobium cenepequi]